MKILKSNILLSIVVILFFSNILWNGTNGALFSQTNNVGIGTLNPAPSALLDVDAAPGNNKGLLVPRLTTAERLAIPSPANSLLVFDTDSSCFFYWNAVASGWKSLCGINQGGSNAATGITGNTGASGNAGSTGSTGASGIAGNTGTTGSTGVAGNDGTIGSTGATGINGITGATGSGTICTTAATNYVTKFTNPTEMCNSIIYDNGSNVGINTGVTPDASAKLEVTSTNMGVLVPRMTTTERNAIVSPAHSLLIFNTTNNCYEWWDSIGSTWISMSCGGSPCTPPVQPGTINGNTTFCSGSTYTYSISSVPGAATYNWGVPAGATINSGQSTTSVSITLGSTAGDITVDASNSCGTSTQSTLNVTIADPSILTTTPGSAVCSGTVALGATASSGATVHWYTVATGGTAVATGNSYTTPSLSTTTTYYVEAVDGSCTSVRTAVVATIKKVVGIRVSAGFYGYTAGDYSNINVTFNQTPTGNTEPQSCSGGCSCGGTGTNFQIQSSGTCLGANIIIRDFTFSTYPTSVTISMVGQGVHSYNPNFYYVYNDGTTDYVSIASSCTADPYYYTTWNVTNTCSLALPACTE